MKDEEYEVGARGKSVPASEAPGSTASYTETAASNPHCLPWRIRAGEPDRFWGYFIDDAQAMCAVVGVPARLDAEFIVRAANSHSELLAALKAMVSIYDGVRDALMGEVVPAKLAAADAAIAKAEWKP